MPAKIAACGELAVLLYFILGTLKEIGCGIIDDIIETKMRMFAKGAYKVLLRNIIG